MKELEIKDNGKVKVLQFTKMSEFEDKVALAIALKEYGNGFKREENMNLTRRKYINISEYLNINHNDIVLLKQDHTNNIITIEKNKKYTIENVDGIITSLKNIPTAITFADCIPIFFYDPVKNVIANIHSGWKGTVNRISLKAVEILIKKYNSKPEDMICMIGPCIRKDHFLVNKDVKDIFYYKFNTLCKKYDIITKTNMYNEKGIQYLIDTVLLNKIMLNKIGLLDKNIIDCNICTVCSNDMFHSRRVEGINYEVNSAIMMLK